jgi:hypothetical protein
MSNQFSREPVAAIKRITSGLGHAARSHRPIADRLTLQCPGSSSSQRSSPMRSTIPVCGCSLLPK